MVQTRSATRAQKEKETRKSIKKPQRPSSSKISLVQPRSETRAQKEKETRKSIKKPPSIIVPKSEWIFAFNFKGEAKGRIIERIKDKNGEEYCRIYEKETESKYYCHGCLTNRRIKNFSEIIDNNFHAQIFHDCKKIPEKMLEKARIISPFTFSKVFGNPEPQNFSLPIPLLRYLIKNPKTPAFYDKLVKACKWFYLRNQLPYVQKIQETDLGYDCTIIEAKYEWDVKDESALQI